MDTTTSPSQDSAESKLGPRERILQAGLKLFVEQGYFNTNVPDISKESDAEARFKEIAEAYAILSDPRKRADYDARGFAGVADFSTEDLFSGIDFGDIFGDMGFGFDLGGGGLFGDFFGRHRHPRGPTKGSDLEVRLTIPLEKVNAGGEETVHVNRPVSCGDCKVTGAEKGSEPRPCSHCNGSGKQVTSRQETKDKRSISFQQILCRLVTWPKTLRSFFPKRSIMMSKLISTA